MAKSGMLGHEGKGPFDMGFLKDIRRVYVGSLPRFKVPE